MLSKNSSLFWCITCLLGAWPHKSCRHFVGLHSQLFASINTFSKNSPHRSLLISLMLCEGEREGRGGAEKCGGACQQGQRLFICCKTISKVIFYAIKGICHLCAKCLAILLRPTQREPLRLPPTSTPAHALTQAGKLCEERLRALVIKTSTLTHTQQGLNMRVQQHKVLENTLGSIW